MVLLSRSTKTIIVVELTVPWESPVPWLAISHELKKAKCQDLIDEASIKGWNGALFPIEVGCRGFPATSVHYFLKKIGFEPKRQRKATGEIAAAAESLRGCSRWEFVSGILLQVKADIVFYAPLRWSVQVKGRNARDPEVPAEDVEIPYNTIRLTMLPLMATKNIASVVALTGPACGKASLMFISP